MFIDDASFRLNIQCHDEIKKIPEREEIEEAAGCAYEVTINHVMGCPLECPRHSVTGRVCSGQGLCFYAGYDSGSTVDDVNDDAGLQCLCSSGHYGTACEFSGFINSISIASGVPVWAMAILLLLLSVAVSLLVALRLGMLLTNQLERNGKDKEESGLLLGDRRSFLHMDE